jgi:hypothetical protein
MWCLGGGRGHFCVWPRNVSLRSLFLFFFCYTTWVHFWEPFGCVVNHITPTWKTESPLALSQLGKKVDTVHLLPALLFFFAHCSFLMPLFYSRQSKYYAPPSESTRWSLKIYTYIVVVVVVVVYGSWEYYNRVYCLHNAADTSLQVNTAGSVSIFPSTCVYIFQLKWFSVRLVLFIALYLVRNDWLPIAFSHSNLHRME